MDQGEDIVYYFYFMDYIIETLNLKWLYFDPNILVHGLYPKKIIREGAKDLYIGMFIMLLFITAKHIEEKSQIPSYE